MWRDAMQERLITQRRQDGRRRLCNGDHRCGGKALLKDRQTGQRLLFNRTQQTPAIFDDGSQAAVPGWEILIDGRDCQRVHGQ